MVGFADDGETVIRAGLREVLEEVGLVLEEAKDKNTVRLLLPKDPEPHSDEDSSEEDPDEISLEDPFTNSYSVLGLWESCFPPVLYVGRPKKQHLIYYLHVSVSQHSEQITQHIKVVTEREKKVAN